MRLIVSWNDTDDYTYNCLKIVPAVYDSAKAFICDLEKICSEMISKCEEAPWPDIEDHFILAGQDFYARDFWYGDEFLAPIIYTVDEWFSEVEVEEENAN